MITITLAHDKDCDRKHLRLTCPHGELLACLARVPKEKAERKPWHDPTAQRAEMCHRLRQRTGCDCQVAEREAAA